MAFIPVPEGAQAELRFLLDNQEIENTLWFDVGVSVSNTQLQNLADALKAWATTHLMPAISNACKLMEVYVTDQSNQFGGAATSSAGAGIAGALVSPPLPNSNTLAISFRTAARGRSFRGRNYVPCLTEQDVTANVVASDRRGQLIAGYNQLLNTANTAGATWCVASRYSNKAPRVAGVLTPVTQVLIADDIVDSQRRRLPGRGR